VRVLHVIDGLGGSGGAENRLVEEVLRIDRSVEQRVVRVFEYDDLDHRLREAGIEVDALGLRSGLGSYNWPLGVWRLLATIGRFRPDVVHTSLFAANLIGQLSARVAGVPVVSTMTLSGDPALFAGLDTVVLSRRAAAMRTLAKWSARLSRARWRAVTEDTKASNCRTLRIPPSRVAVISRGVDGRRFGQEPDRARFELPDGPLFVNVARHAPQKGQLMLVEAFARVLDEIPGAHLAIAGKFGPLTTSIKERAEALGIAERLHLLGFRTDSAVLLASADVFLFSSMVEGIGTAALEAVAAGLPVVAFDIAPIREVTAAHGLATLVPPGDVGAFAAAAVAALRLRDRAVQEGRRRQVLSDFELGTIAGRVEALLREVARSRAYPPWRAGP